MDWEIKPGKQTYILLLWNLPKTLTSFLNSVKLIFAVFWKFIPHFLINFSYCTQFLKSGYKGSILIVLRKVLTNKVLNAHPSKLEYQGAPEATLQTTCRCIQGEYLHRLYIYLSVRIFSLKRNYMELRKNLAAKTNWPNLNWKVILDFGSFR